MSVRVSRAVGWPAVSEWLASSASRLMLLMGTVPGAPIIPDFVLPLTDRMVGSKARDMVAILRPRIAGFLAAQHVLCDLALMADPGRGRRWRVLDRYRLAESALDAHTQVPDGMDCPDQRSLPPLESVMGSDWETVIA